MITGQKSQRPLPTPYHSRMVEHLRTAEPGLWNWFSSTQKRLGEADAVRLDLLKSTYRLERQAQSKLYDLASEVRDRLGLTCGVTLYQAQTAVALNASLAYLPGEAHVIFAGPLATVLTDGELRAVVAHELAHFLLYEQACGAYLVASDLLRGLAADVSAGPAASESARLYALWTEIYADRWALHVCGDLMAAVAALIKIQTGLSEVSAESYLRQAEEVFAKADTPADGASHPESYIRARALRLWAEQGDQAQAEFERMIEGRLMLDRLDLLGQVRAADLTRHFLQRLLSPRWFQTDAVLAHARQFFPEFVIPPEAPNDDAVKSKLDQGDRSLRDYLCYLMLDFATVDRDIGDVALAASIVLARRLGFADRFAELVRKELTLSKKAFAKIEKDAEAILAKTEAAPHS
jgi:Zn-dependent protease with chaperone function